MITERKKGKVEKMNTNTNVEKTAELLGKLVGKIIVLFLHTAFIMWGWNIIAPLLGAPVFGYWQIFAMKLAFSVIIKMFRRSVD